MTVTSPQSPVLKNILDAGVSLWLDDLSRAFVMSGELNSFIATHGISGVTTNPSIFASALTSDASYQHQLEELKQKGESPESALWKLMVADVQAACDAFGDLYKQTSGADGYVSLEVSPDIAHDQIATVNAARQLWQQVGRPNAMIKIPATAAGIQALPQVLAEGINVNMTLIFSLEQYRAVLRAHRSGIEAARSAGVDIAKIASVASFFISRVDAVVDAKLKEINTPAAQALLGNAASANARVAFSEYLEFCREGASTQLAMAGARPQRPLWASTGTKDPVYPGYMYVTGLVASGIVNTVPRATLQSAIDDGEFLGDTVTPHIDASRSVLEQVNGLGIDLTAITSQLLIDGLKKFSIAWHELLATVTGALQGPEAAEAYRAAHRLNDTQAAPATAQPAADQPVASQDAPSEVVVAEANSADSGNDAAQAAAAVGVDPSAQVVDATAADAPAMASAAPAVEETTERRRGLSAAVELRNQQSGGRSGGIAAAGRAAAAGAAAAGAGIAGGIGASGPDQAGHADQPEVPGKDTTADDLPEEDFPAPVVGQAVSTGAPAAANPTSPAEAAATAPPAADATPQSQPDAPAAQHDAAMPQPSATAGLSEAAPTSSAAAAASEVASGEAAQPEKTVQSEQAAQSEQAVQPQQSAAAGQAAPAAEAVSGAATLSAAAAAVATPLDSSPEAHATVAAADELDVDVAGVDATPAAMPTVECPLQIAIPEAIVTRVSPAVQKLTSAAVCSRVNAQDHTVWGTEAESEASKRLGWVSLPQTSMGLVDEIYTLRDELLGEGISRIVLCGMGGSSLAPEVMAATDRVSLVVLDSTDPEQVHRATAIGLKRTAVVVASKSGSTVETDSQRRAFLDAFASAGIDAAQRMIVVTDEGSPLAQQALADGYRKVFYGDTNVGGRYSALSAFGLVPAGLAGVDLRSLLAPAADATLFFGADSPQNPAAVLGAVIGDTSAGHSKIVLAPGPGCPVGLGDWIEQLIAESTGKQGTGILPVVVDSLDAPEVVAPTADSTVIELRGPYETDAIPASRVVISGSLGAHMQLWEFATAVSGQLLGINPFDQPDVESAKVAAHTMLTTPAGSVSPTFSAEGVDVYASSQIVGATTVAAAVDAVLDTIDKEQGYLSVMAYLDRTAKSGLENCRSVLAAKTKRPVTFGWGPRYLHSTGQLHKGGPKTGAYIVITTDYSRDVAVPGQAFSFAELIAAQARGDVSVLTDHGLPVLHLHVTDTTVGMTTVRSALGIV